VSSVDKTLLFLKTKKEHDYHWLYFNKSYWERLYEHIDFQQSQFEVYNDRELVDIRITSLEEVYNLKKSERYVKLTSKKIVLNDFDCSIDIFKLPLFSWMTYVSSRLQDKLLEQKITDIKFVETGIKSRLEAVQNPLIEMN
jgi:hypothetical protein